MFFFEAPLLALSTSYRVVRMSTLYCIHHLGTLGIRQ